MTTLFGANGAVSAFNPGTIFGTSCYNGCTNNERTGIIRFTPLAVPYHHGTVFAYASYDVAPDITASIQLNYGLSGERSLGGGRSELGVLVFTTWTLRSDEPDAPSPVLPAVGLACSAASLPMVSSAR